MRKLSVPAAPMLMAFVLGPQAEAALRQSMILSDNSPLIFIQRPIAASIVVLIIAMISFSVINRRKQRLLARTDGGATEALH